MRYFEMLAKVQKAEEANAPAPSFKLPEPEAEKPKKAKKEKVEEIQEPETVPTPEAEEAPAVPEQVESED